MKLSAALMAYPSRRLWVDQLLAQLGDIPVALDRFSIEWDTARRAMLAHDPEADYHLVIQDDALVCRDLLAGVERALRFAGGRPVSFYTGTVRPYADDVAAAIDYAIRQGASWVSWPGPWWGVAVAYPVADIPAIIAAADRWRSTLEYDQKVARWYRNEGRQCLYSVPSLVDHRPMRENPSLLGGREDRRAHRWIGAEASALDIGWTERIASAALGVA